MREWWLLYIGRQKFNNLATPEIGILIKHSIKTYNHNAYASQDQDSAALEKAHNCNRST